MTPLPSASAAQAPLALSRQRFWLVMAVVGVAVLIALFFWSRDVDTTAADAAAIDPVSTPSVAASALPPAPTIMAVVRHPAGGRPFIAAKPGKMRSAKADTRAPADTLTDEITAALGTVPPDAAPLQVEAAIAKPIDRIEPDCDTLLEALRRARKKADRLAVERALRDLRDTLSGCDLSTGGIGGRGFDFAPIPSFSISGSPDYRT